MIIVGFFDQFMTSEHMGRKSWKYIFRKHRETAQINRKMFSIERPNIAPLLTFSVYHGATKTSILGSRAF